MATEAPSDEVGVAEPAPTLEDALPAETGVVVEVASEERTGHLRLRNLHLRSPHPSNRRLRRPQPTS